MSEKTNDSDYINVLSKIEEMACKLFDSTAELCAYIYENRDVLNKNPEPELDVQIHAWDAGRFPLRVMQAVRVAKKADSKKG